MGSNVCSRPGASERRRLRAPHRLALGSVAFDLMPDGWVRIVRPSDTTGEFCDLRAFLTAMRAKGGA